MLVEPKKIETLGSGVRRNDENRPIHPQDFPVLTGNRFSLRLCAIYREVRMPRKRGMRGGGLCVEFFYNSFGDYAEITAWNQFFGWCC